MFRVLSLAVCLFAAPLAWAHPHVFVQVGLRLETDEAGRLTGVEVTWTYDQLFSLLIMSDEAVMADGSAGLSDEDKALLMGFDLEDWPDGFEGALFVYLGQDKLALQPPEALDVALDRRGRLVTRHRRAIDPVAVNKVVTVRPYDPYYYAALDLTGEVTVPAGCEGKVIEADTKAADALVADLGWTGDEALFEEVQVGIHYADTLEVTCAGS